MCMLGLRDISDMGGFQIIWLVNGTAPLVLFKQLKGSDCQNHTDLQ